MATLGDLAARIIISADDRTGPAIRSVNAGTQSMVAGITALETAAKRILGITLFVGLGKEALELSETYEKLQFRLKAVSDSTEDYTKANKALFEAAQSSHSGLTETYDIYIRIRDAIKSMGGTQEQAIVTTETLHKAIALTSKGADQDSEAIMQFARALAVGELKGKNLNNILLRSPGLAQALADGMGVSTDKLKQMGNTGQLSIDKIINALVKSAPVVAEKFAQLPVTVGKAMENVHNAMLQFIGQSDLASSASSKLSIVIQSVAKYFNEIAAVAINLAEIYGARLVIGMVASTKAFFDNAAAAKLAAIAATEARAAGIALLQVRVTEAAAAVQVKTQLVIEAAQRRALATSTAAETVAIAKLATAQNALVASQNRLVAANTRLAASQETTAASSGILSTALGFLGKALNGLMVAWIAWDIGKTVGEWLRQFESVRLAGTWLAEAFMLLQTAAEAMINGMSFSDRLEQVKKIHEDFNAIRTQEGLAQKNAADQVVVTEEEKTKAVEAAALKQQQAFATTQAAVKALTATIDAETKSEAAAIQQGLSDRLAAIERMDLTTTQRDTLKAQAKLTADTQERLLNKQAFDLKLQLINQEYAAELLLAQNNAERLKAVETSKREAKLSVYRGVADYYAGEIAKLSGLYNEETSAFAKSRTDLESLEKDHKNALRDLDRLYKTDYENLRQDQSDFDQKLDLIRIERKKGEKADQNKINDLLDDTKKLSGNLSEAAKKGDIDQWQAKDNLNKLYNVEKLALVDSAKAHENNAAAIKKSLAEAQTGLTEANLKIKELTDALTKEYLMKVGLDPSTLSAAQAAIADLVKPETKIITIVTQNSQSAGGPVGFARGGYANKSGYLPGFGGGDKIKALLEAGEFIVRKEAVQALGVPVLHNWINQGQLPIKRASGGFVSNTEIADAVEKKKREGDAEIVGTLLNNITWYKAVGGGSNALQAMQETLHKMGKDYLISAVAEGMTYANSAKGYQHTDNSLLDTQHDRKSAEGSARFIAAKDLIMEKIKSGATDLKLSKVAPAISMPSIDLNQFATKAAASATGQKAESKLFAPAKKTVNVNFTAPGADAVSGQFNENDMDKLFKALKSAGLRTSV
jgi:tape measure domain-containing protein